MSHERDLPFTGQHRELIVDVAEMLLERDRSSMVDDGILFDANGVLAYDPDAIQEAMTAETEDGGGEQEEMWRDVDDDDGEDFVLPDKDELRQAKLSAFLIARAKRSTLSLSTPEQYAKVLRELNDERHRREMAEAECESWRIEAEGYKQHVEELEKALAGRVSDLRYAALVKAREEQWKSRVKLLEQRQEQICQEWDFIKNHKDKYVEVFTGGLPEGVVETVIYDATKDKVDFSFHTWMT